MAQAEVVVRLGLDVRLDPAVGDTSHPFARSVVLRDDVAVADHVGAVIDRISDVDGCATAAATAG